MAVIVETLMAEDLELGTSTTSKTHPAGGVLNGHQISLSTLSVVGASGVANSKAWDLSSSGIDINGYVSETVDVPGAAVGDMVLVSLDTMVTNACLISGHVSAADVVTVVIYNPTAAKVYPASGTLRVLVFKYRQ